MSVEDRLIAAEEIMAHQARVTEDLNAIVATQSARIDVLEKRVHMLLTRAAEADADGSGGVVIGGETPPHY